MAGMDHILNKAYLAQSGASAPLLFGQVVNQVAGTTLDPNQAQVAPLLAALPVNAAPLGVCQENMDLVKIATGKAYFSVALLGTVKVIYDGTAQALYPGVAPYAGGLVVPCATAGTIGSVTFIARTAVFRGIAVLGVAMDLPTTKGDIFDVTLTPGLMV